MSIKSNVSAIMAAICLSCLTPTLSLAANYLTVDASKVCSSCDGANLRQYPSTDSAVLYVVPNGEPVKVIQSMDTGWSYVAYGNNLRGYIRTSLLR